MRRVFVPQRSVIPMPSQSQMQGCGVCAGNRGAIRAVSAGEVMSLQAWWAQRAPIQIRYGTTRHVVLWRHWALKLPAWTTWRLFLCGLLANMQEREFAKTGWPELCPVVWSVPGGWLVVMRRAIPMSRAERETFDPSAWSAHASYVIPVEAKMDSFGYIDERVVAVDYGS